MVRISRRSFVEKLGLGVGATLLTPLAGGLIGEARGQAPARRRAAFFVGGQNVATGIFNPVSGVTTPKDGITGFALKPMHASLEKYKSRLLLVGGLSNHHADSHTGGFTSMSCVVHPVTPRNSGSAGGVTIDQLIAGRLGSSTRLRSVLWGIDSMRFGVLDTRTSMFASGLDRPEPFPCNPSLMFKSVFGDIAPVPGGGGVNKGALKQRLLMDAIRTDLKRLQGALAGPERLRLEQHLALLEDFEVRVKAVADVSCSSPPRAMPVLAKTTNLEDLADALNEMAIVALACGLTNVVGASLCAGESHAHMGTYRRIHKGTQYEAEGGVSSKGHDPGSIQDPAMTIINGYHVSLMARMADALGSIKEGDGTALDRALLVYFADNSSGHHSGKEDYNFTILGNGGGKLKADGRFVRYRNDRGACDLFTTFTHTLGVPVDNFGDGPTRTFAPRGPMTELLG